MDKKKIDKHTCTFQTVSRQGQTNLCCCYVMDSQGNYQDPCFTPVDACCLTSPSTESLKKAINGSGLE